MYKLLFLLSIFQFSGMISFGQVRIGPRQIDSLNTIREIDLLKEQFKLNEQQERKLFSYGLQIAGEKRRIYKAYWKTPEFHQQMARVEFVKDSVFNRVLGKGGYRSFIDKREYQQSLKTKALRKRQVQATDSTVFRNPGQ
jgi:hypothetical protein